MKYTFYLVVSTMLSWSGIILEQKSILRYNKEQILFYALIACKTRT